MRSDRSTPERIERPAAAPVNAYGRLAEAVQAEGAAALVSLIETQGSSPREAGAWMVVRPSGGFHGTIGGGAMEWRALEEARALLAQGGTASRRSVAALGPELAQCCGGRVEWRIETFGPPDLPDLQCVAGSEEVIHRRRSMISFRSVGPDPSQRVQTSLG